MERTPTLSHLKHALATAIRSRTAPVWLAEAMARCYSELAHLVMLASVDRAKAEAVAARAEKLLETWRAVPPSSRNRVVRPG